MIEKLREKNVEKLGGRKLSDKNEKLRERNVDNLEKKLFDKHDPNKPPDR